MSQNRERPALSFEERRWLRLLINEEARRRLREAEPDWHRCRGCGDRLSVRTPGCSSCENRWKMRRRRTRERWGNLSMPTAVRAGGYARWNGDQNSVEV
jgi:hypothetical protein